MFKVNVAKYHEKMEKFRSDFENRIPWFWEYIFSQFKKPYLTDLYGINFATVNASVKKKHIWIQLDTKVDI